MPSDIIAEMAEDIFVAGSFLILVLVISIVAAYFTTRWEFRRIITRTKGEEEIKPLLGAPAIQLPPEREPKKIDLTDLPVD